MKKSVSDITVHEFTYVPGVNDAEYIQLLLKDVECKRQILIKSNETIRRLCREAERAKGRWLHNYSRPGVYADVFWHCSNCGEKSDSQWANQYAYCPYCGAKMVDGEMFGQ